MINPIGRTLSSATRNADRSDGLHLSRAGWSEASADHVESFPVAPGASNESKIVNQMKGATIAKISKTLSTAESADKDAVCQNDQNNPESPVAAADKKSSNSVVTPKGETTADFCFRPFKLNEKESNFDNKIKGSPVAPAENCDSNSVVNSKGETTANF